MHVRLRVAHLRLGLLLTCLAACGGDPSATLDAAQTPDLASSVDAATPDLAVADLAMADLAMADLTVEPDLSMPDLAMAPDLATVDAASPPPDLAQPPDLAPSCAKPSGDGMDHVISTPSRPLVGSPILAYDGSSTMAVWTVAAAGSELFPSFGQGAWARIVGGAAVAQGSLPAAITDVRGGQLFVFAGKYHLFLKRSLYVFSSGSWSQVAGFSADAIAMSAGRLVGITGKLGTKNVRATMYDGTTAGTATPISTNYFLAVGGDDAGGFGVFTIENTSPTTIHFLSFDGMSWSSESTVGTQAVNIASLTAPAATHAGSLWCLAYVNIEASGYVPRAWVYASGSWTEAGFAPGTQIPRLLLAANNGGFAIGGSSTWTAVYSGGTWSELKLGNASAQPVSILPYGTGYAFGLGWGIDGYAVAIYSGGAWGTPTKMTSASVSGLPLLAVDGTTIAAAWIVNGGPFEVDTAIYSGSAWGPTTSITTEAYGQVALSAGGGEVLTALPTPGTMKARPYSSSTWQATFTLPGPAAKGAVATSDGVQIARAQNGHALATWRQFDGDGDYVYVAEHDGAAWKTPVQIDRGNSPRVAVRGNTFVLAWIASSTRWAAVWNGSGIGTKANLGVITGTNGGIYGLAADPDGYIAAYEDSGGGLYTYVWSLSSSDGVTWSAPQKIESSANAKMLGLVGGPAGVLAWSTATAGTAVARLWSGGAWSASTSASATTTSGLGCRGAVGDTAAVLACANSTVRARLYSSGAWTSIDPGALADTGMALATDGTDFRLDYYYIGNPMASKTLHAGTWSAAEVFPGGGLTSYSSNAGACGRWLLNYGSATGVAVATGSAAYTASTTLQPFSVYNQSFFPSGRGVVDAAWASGVTSGGVPVAHAALGL